MSQTSKWVPSSVRPSIREPKTDIKEIVLSRGFSRLATYEKMWIQLNTFEVQSDGV